MAAAVPWTDLPPEVLDNIFQNIPRYQLSLRAVLRIQIFTDPHCVLWRNRMRIQIILAKPVSDPNCFSRIGFGSELFWRIGFGSKLLFGTVSDPNYFWWNQMWIRTLVMVNKVGLKT